MAITRAQQAKQLLALGGRIGLQGGGKDASSDYFGGGNTGGGNGGNTDREKGIVSRGKGPKGTTGTIDRGPDRTAVGPDSQFAKNRARRNIDRMLTGLRQTITPSTQPGNRALRTILNITTPGLGEVFASTIDKAQPDIFGTKTDDNNVDREEGGPFVQQRPVMSAPETTAPVTSAPAVDLNRVAYRLMADGGAVIDDEPRQAYGLGSIVKKATRAVKKVAKSDIGKLALTAAAIYFAPAAFGGTPGFGAGSTYGNFFRGVGASAKAKAAAAGLSPQDYMRGIGGKTPETSSLLGNIFKGKTGLATTGILAASALPLLGVGVEEEDESQPATSPYLTEGLDIAAIRANPRKFQGQAYRLMAEGGDTEDAKEPVAKKVMPLIDMDGKEKDYRETGGFVDMGRMEKADDVPARLSKNEFVFTADAVRNAGDGSVDKGAEVMYNMMKNLEAGGEVSEESQGLKGARKMFQTSQRLEEVL